MDNLDVGGSLSFPWMPYGASQFSECQVNGDFGFLSQRSSMLEPIIEETSDDDDVSCGHVWTHSESQWSSESDTGSVIRVELIPGNQPFATKTNSPQAIQTICQVLDIKNGDLNRFHCLNSTRITCKPAINANDLFFNFSIEPINYIPNSKLIK